jgi:ABC-type transport system substrate-binding protein
MTPHSPPPRRRRRLLAALAAAALTTVLAACGSDDDDADEAPSDVDSDATAGDSGTAPADEGDFDPEGVLRVGVPIAAGSDMFTTDPGKTMHHNAMDFNRLIYEPLLRPLGQGQFEPALATSWEVVDPNTIELELREGVTFQDDTPVDAEAVAFSILRNRDSGDVTFRRPELQTISDVVATGPLSVRITFSEPWAGAFVHQLSTIETLIASPTAAEAGLLETTAVGAGPFKLVWSRSSPTRRSCSRSGTATTPPTRSSSRRSSSSTSRRTVSSTHCAPVRST